MVRVFLNIMNGFDLNCIFIVIYVKVLVIFFYVCVNCLGNKPKQLPDILYATVVYSK